MLVLDFTKPETLKKLAELPRYGWAEALVRRVDPLWKVSSEEPVRFKVRMERGEEGCPDCGGRCCGEVDTLETKHVFVDAHDEESAIAAAELEMADKGEIGWVAMSPRAMVCSATVPDEYLAWFESPQRPS